VKRCVVAFLVFCASCDGAAKDEGVKEKRVVPPSDGLPSDGGELEPHSAEGGWRDFAEADFGTDTGTPAGDGLEFVPMHHLAGDGHAPEAYFVHDEAGNKRDEIRHDLDELQNRLDEIDLQIEQKRK